MAIKMREINMDKVRAKLEQLKNPSAFKKNPNKWSPKRLEKGKTEGEISTIRVIRRPDDDDPFLTLFFHYGIGEGENRNFLCLKRNFGKDCPACEFASELWNKDSEQQKELAKQLFANARHHAIVIDREEEEPAPKWWGFGVGVYDELVDSLEKKGYEKYMNYYDGIDIEVKYKKTSASRMYPSTDLTFLREESALADTDGKIQKILDAIKKPEEMWQPLSKSEISAQLSNWLSSDESAEKSSSETVKGGNGSAKVATVEDVTEDSGPEKEMTPEDVESAFEEALG